MLKLYRPLHGGFGGQNIDSWEETWKEASLQDSLRWVETCHLRQVFERYLPRKGRILEGGCGPGHFVVYYRRRGYDIEGIDFASNAIQQLKKYDPSLPVQVGDVTALPHADNSIDAYYSGGVVEHFEGGPFKALAEAHRVLSPGGKLIITVPFFNPIRRLKMKLRFWGRDPMYRDTVAMNCNEFSVTEVPNSKVQFCEYYFSQREFAAILRQAGFRILEAYPWSVEWGEFCQTLYGLMGRGAGAVQQSTTQPSSADSKSDSSTKSVRAYLSGAKRLWKTLFLLEDRSTLPRRLLVSMLSWTGHMLLFVCEPQKQGVHPLMGERVPAR